MVKYGHKGRDPVPVLKEKRKQGCMHTDKRPREDTPKSRLSTNQAEWPQEKPNLPTP